MSKVSKMYFRDAFTKAKSKLDEVSREFKVSSGMQQSHGFPFSTQQRQQHPQQQYYHQQQLCQHHQQPPKAPGSPTPSSLSGPPPPPPYITHAQMAAHQHVYWQLHCDPSRPISYDWEQKLGNQNGWGNNELEFYTANPANAFYTPDNKLVLRAVANVNAPDPSQRYTSARLVSRQTLAHNRGVLTGFLTLPCATGIWPAFWLLPREPFTWPHEGEIDIAETWNGDRDNHSCLHWGFYNAEDHLKHRVKSTPIEDMHQRGVRFDLMWWCQDGPMDRGRLMWYIDGRPVMKAAIPLGTRHMSDFQIILNVAMGGNVCGGKAPLNGVYDMIVHALYMSNSPDPGQHWQDGWQRFEEDWHRCPEGKGY